MTFPARAGDQSVTEFRATTSESISSADRLQLDDISASVGSDDITPDLTTAEKVVTLAPKACRWPYGDPEHSDFRFCGDPVVAPPYCELHRGMAHVTPRIGGGHDARSGLVAHERRPRPQQVSEAQRQRLYVLRRLLWRARKQAANSCTAFPALPDHVREHRSC
jgi:GcrA cell cycle regulator